MILDQKGEQAMVSKQSSTVRITLPSDAEITPEIGKTLANYPPLNVFRMMARAPASFQPLVEFARSILLESEFDPRKREIAVLRVAHVTGAGYEWAHHVTVGTQVGLGKAEIERIAVAGPVTGLDEEGNLLCRVADEISRDVRLSDEALDAILSRYGERQATELILCCSYFNMLSRFLESTRVELEDGLELERAREGARELIGTTGQKR
jgi:alkylhydroperoxidase family enzyme